MTFLVNLALVFSAHLEDFVQSGTLLTFQFLFSQTLFLGLFFFKKEAQNTQKGGH